MKDDRVYALEITTGTIVKAILLLLLCGALYYLRDLVLIILTAIVIASAVEPATKKLGEYKIPRVPAVLVVYTFGGLFVATLFFFVIPELVAQSVAFLGNLPQLLQSFTLTDSATETATNIAEQAGAFSLQSLLLELQSLFAASSEGLLVALSAIFGGLFSLVLIVVFSFYFAVQEDGITEFLKIVAPLRSQDRVVDLWKRSQKKIGLWMQGQLTLGLIIFILTYLVLAIFQVPYALLLAILAGVFELIPLFGPILAGIPAVIVAFNTDTAMFDGPILAFVIFLLYFMIQQLENHLIYPLVVKKVVGVPPILVIIALLVGGQLAGFLGIILSVPIAAALQEFISDIEKGKKLAESNGSS